MVGFRRVELGITFAAIVLMAGVSLAVHGVGSQVVPTVAPAPRGERGPVRPAPAVAACAERMMPLSPIEVPARAPAVESAASPEARLRLFGSAAALRIVESALLVTDAPGVEFVRGREVENALSAEFDAAIVLSPAGQPFSPGGMYWCHLGDFVPVVLAPLEPRTGSADAGETWSGSAVAVRRWLPLIEACMPQLAGGRGLVVRSERDLAGLQRVRRQRPDALAVVSLAVLDRPPLHGAPTMPVRGVQPSRLAYRAGDYGCGLQVHLVFPRRTAEVERLLEHLLRGAGRVELRRVLI